MWWRKRSQCDFASDVQSHLELEADRLRAEGLSDEDALFRARRAFGNVLGSRERFYESQQTPWLDHLKRDITYALRQLAKDRVFTIVSTLTLALGIGSTIAIFTLVDRTLLGPLPYQEGDQIVHITDVRVQGKSTGGLVGVPRFFDLQKTTKSYDSLGFYCFDHPTMITGSSLPVPLAGVCVNGEFWKTIGIHPFLGRAFEEIDDHSNAPSVAIISYTVWQRLFNGDPNVVNRQVKLDGKGTTIVGVLPAGLEYPHNTEVWTPAQFDPAQWTWRGEGTRFVNVLGRLKRDVSFASAQAELQTIGERLRREHPDTDGVWRFGSETLRDYLYGSVRPAILVLLAASAVLLLIACVNVANLLLSRGTARVQEVSLRRALGASYGRILAQFLTENTLLALLGGAVGLLAAYISLRWFGTKLPGRLGTAGIGLNWPVVCFAFFLSVLTGILFGCVPALQARRLDLSTSLKQGDSRLSKAGGNRLRAAFISIQVALSLVLLMGASLLAESLWHLLNAPLGFEPDHVLAFDLKLPWNAKPEVVQRFYEEVQQRLEVLPGVWAVGQVSALPTVDWHLRSSFDVDWEPRTPHGDAVNVEDRAVGGDYFRAIGIPLLAGRYLTESDRKAKPPRAMVNQQFVRQYISKGSAIGHQLINKVTHFEIVGVTGNVRGTAGSIAAPPGPEFYFLSDEGDPGRSFVIRSRLPADQLARVIREQVHQVDRTQAVRNISTLNQLLDASVAQPRFNMGLLSAFAIAATVLACVGIYGIVSYSVAQRSIEVGIRMTLGATRQQIAYLFVRRTVTAAATGVLIGGVAAVFLTRLLTSELYGVPPGHLLTLIVSALLLLLTTLLAGFVPALRAALLNPVRALHTN